MQEKYWYLLAIHIALDNKVGQSTIPINHESHVHLGILVFWYALTRNHMYINNLDH